MKIEMFDKKEMVSPEILSETEQGLEVKFPQDYTDFMSEHNGGVPKIAVFSLPDGTNTSVVNHFYSIGEMKGNLKKVNWILDGEIPNGFISVGDDSAGNEILMCVKGEKLGEIFFWEHDVDPDEEDPMHFLANSFNDFLEMLHK